MKYITVGFLLIGLAILGGILYHIDLAAVWSHLREIGWWGIGGMIVLNGIITLVDVASWQLALPTVPLTVRWLYRLFAVRMVGEAVSETTPFASLGGEPVKAMLLNQHYAIGYRDAVASLLLAQTTMTIGLVGFLLGSVPFALYAETLPATHQLWLGITLLTFSVCVWLFFLVQRYQMVSRLSRWLAPYGLSARFRSVFEVAEDVEGQLVAFYTKRRRRFVLSVVCTVGRWVLGVIELYLILMFLGYPVTLVEAWVIEAVVSLVRATLFVVPANLGTQEGALVLMCELVTGMAALGLAVGLLRRSRELAWIGCGFLIGWCYSWKPRAGGSPPTPAAGKGAGGE